MSGGQERRNGWLADQRTLRFLSLLWRGGKAGYLWRKASSTYWVGTASLEADFARLNATWDTDTYFGVHPCARAKSAYERARNEDIVAANCLFADFDGKGGDLGELLKRIEGLQPAPQVIIRSGGGYHCYWLLTEPVILADDAARKEWGELQRWWVHHVGADPAACDLARVLRVPGTLNMKYDPPRPVEWVRHNFDDPCDNDALLRYIVDERTRELERAHEPERAHGAQNGAKPPAAAGKGRGASVIDAYNQATNIRDALTAYGYTLVGERYFARPGKDAREGTSGTIDDARNRAYTFSSNDPAYDASNTSPSGAGCTLYPFDLLCRLSFGGDAGRAVRYLRECANGSHPASLNGHAPPAEAIPSATIDALREVEREKEREQEKPTAILELVKQGGELAHQPALHEHELNETAAALLLAANFGDRLRYTDGRGWLCWGNGHWAEDEDAREPSRSAQVVAGAYLARAMEAEGGLGKKFLTFGKSLMSARGVKAVVELARKKQPIASSEAYFDRDAWLLNTPGGIVDLRTGEVKPHDPAAMLTRITGVAPENQPTPTWERFLRDALGNDEVCAFVERWFGYCLTGDTREQRYLVAIGDGRNGKSTLFETVRYIMGSYATAISTAALAMRYRANETNNDVARLPGVRYAIVPEWDEALRIDGTLIKQLSGRDTISVRKLFREPFEFHPACKLVIYGNSRPALPGTDTGTWRRPILLPFKQRFEGERDDKQMPNKLRAEAPGILYRLLQACQVWQREGLRVPQVLEQATQSWRAESNEVEQFIAECCLRGADFVTGSSQLYEAYKRWGGAMSQKKFALALSDAGYERRKTPRGVQVCGVGLRAEG